MAQHVAAKTNRFAGAGAVHHQARNAALDKIGDAAHELNFLGDIEAVEEHHARRTFAFGIFRMHKVTGQTFFTHRHFNDFYFDAGEFGVFMKTIDAGFECC